MLKYIEKYRHYFVNEALWTSDELYGLISYLDRTKNNKVARYLLVIRNSDAYPDEEPNFFSTASQDNQLSFLTSDRYKKMDGGSPENDITYTSPLRSSMRVGRAVKKILDTARSNSSFKYKGKCKIFLDSWNASSIYVESKNFDKKKLERLMIISDTDSNNILETTKVELKVNGETIRLSSEYSIVIQSSEGDSNGVINFHIDYSTKNRRLFNNNWRTSYYRSEHVKNKDGDRASRDSIPEDTDCEITIETKINVNDADIEKFTNEYISLVKLNKADESSKIEEIKGLDIKKWYNFENYQTRMGKLGSSCMSGEDSQEYFDIYIENPKVVSLLILKNQNEKLLGRALLWKTNKGYFMDRVYTISDHDDNIFVNYAIEKGYFYRNTTNSRIVYYREGKEVPIEKMDINLENYDFEYYPYLDTFYILDMENGTLSNKASKSQRYNDLRILRSTEGEYEEGDLLEEDYEDYEEN